MLHCANLSTENIDRLLAHLSWVEVRSCQHVFKVNVSVGILLLHHDHGICLPQQRPSSSQLTQFNQLQHNLYNRKESMSTSVLGNFNLKQFLRKVVD